MLANSRYPAQVEGYLREVVNGQPDNVLEEVIAARCSEINIRQPDRQATVDDDSPGHPQAHSVTPTMPSSRENLANFTRQGNHTQSNQLIDLGMSETLPPFGVMEEL